jgi:hypothetical protein
MTTQFMNASQRGFFEGKIKFWSRQKVGKLSSFIKQQWYSQTFYGNLTITIYIRIELNRYPI